MEALFPYLQTVRAGDGEEEPAILFGVEGLGRRLSSSVQPQCMRHAFDHVGNALTLASQGTADTLLDC